MVVRLRALVAFSAAAGCRTSCLMAFAGLANRYKSTGTYRVRYLDRYTSLYPHALDASRQRQSKYLIPQGRAQRNVGGSSVLFSRTSDNPDAMCVVTQKTSG